MPFDFNAFLGDQVKEIRYQHVEENKDIFTIAYDLNRFVNEVKYETKHTDDNMRDNVLLGLFCKLIQTFNSIIILLELGLESDAKSLIRSLLETAIHHNAIINAPEYFDDYINKGYLETLRMATNIKKNSEYFDETINTFINDKYIDELQVESNKIKTKSNFEVAKLANLEDIYLTIYNLMSLNVHGNVKAVDKFMIKEENVIKSLDMLPRYTEIRENLYTTIFILIETTTGLNAYYNLQKNQKIEEFTTQLNEIFHKS